MQCNSCTHKSLTGMHFALPEQAQKIPAWSLAGMSVPSPPRDDKFASLWSGILQKLSDVTLLLLLATIPRVPEVCMVPPIHPRPRQELSTEDL